MAPAGFEPANPASEQPQTRSLDRAATGVEILYTIHFFSYTVLSCVNFKYSDYFTAITCDLLDIFVFYSAGTIFF